MNQDRNNFDGVGGSRVFFRRPFKYTFFNATLLIILINFSIFALSVFSERAAYYIHTYGCLNVIMIEKYRMVWQFLTYMFVHQNLSHVFFNMFGLLIFGFQLEKAIGSKEFLLFYLIAGTLSGFFSYLVYKFTGMWNVFLLGASGALYAVLFAYAVVFPRSVIYVWGIIPLPAPVMVGIYTVVEIGSQFIGSTSNVAHLTHLFGFFSAWLYFVIRMGIHPLKIWKNTYKN